ncbi:MAG: ribonuclease HII, partial [Pseudomonadota bacterium]
MVIETPNFDFEDSQPAPVAGVDEAGRGPLAGPVVAAAVIIDRRCAPMGVRDSKTLSEQRRDTIAAEIRACAAVGVG